MTNSAQEQTIKTLTDLAEQHCRQQVEGCQALAQSGSHRQYYRITLGDGSTIIGAFNDDISENLAFFSYTDFFSGKQLPVPHILAIAPDLQHYLQNDLGPHTLYDLLSANRVNGQISDEVVHYYEQAAKSLPALQLTGTEGLDFSVAYPRAAFDRQSMQWDLNYFKYYFLKLVNIPFDEQKLENDYNTFIDYLLSADSNYFLYRDFQSRNIMVQDGKVYFIDYQGGRRGALQYDIASLLYDAKADLSPEFRTHLLNIYLDELSKHITVDRKAFLSYFQGFVLIRILQSMGAYGYRGYFEKKSHFLQSVPYAVHNMENLLDHFEIPIELPELTRVLRSIIASDFVKPYKPAQTLTVLVQSFSFKKGIPQDPSPNGGGFVFDCRALPNPGREPQYKQNTGKDQCIKDYLNQFPAVDAFRNNVFALVDQAVENYLERHFDHLMVSTGCTGGQHRSVFFAEEVAAHITQKYPAVNVILRHTAQE